MSDFFCNICATGVNAFELSPEGTDRCPKCRSVGRHRAVALLLQEHRDIRPSYRALEIGGDGQFFQSYFHRLISADLCASGVDVLSDAERLSFSSDCFDVILCLDVLEHVGDDLAAVKEISRVLGPGGTLFVTASCWGDNGTAKTPQEAGLPKFHLSRSGRWDCPCYRYYSFASLTALIESGNMICHPFSVTNSYMAIEDVRILVALKPSVTS